MGSSLETAIAVTLVITVLAIFAVSPIKIWDVSLENGVSARDEIVFHMNNLKPCRSKEIHGHDSNDMSPEVINTVISGMIDTVKIAGR